MKLENLKRVQPYVDYYGNKVEIGELEDGDYLFFKDVQLLSSKHKEREAELVEALIYAKAWLESFDGIQMSLKMNNPEVKSAFEKINSALGIKS